MGRVEAIWIKRARKGPMDSADSATFEADRGITGNANQGGRRQVTVIAKETFDRIRGDLPEARPVMRRANVMVSGLDLAETRDRVLRLGEVRLLIKGETRPCERMDAQCAGLTAALDPAWGGGVFGVVLDDGELRVGDSATLEAGDAPAP